MSRLFIPAWQKGLPTTGQSTSYNDYDDGYFEVGCIANDKNRFTQFAVTGLGFFVRDEVTGLIWPRVPFDSITTGPDLDDTYTYANALTAVTGAGPQCNGNPLGGWTDWRMPNLLEMMSLLDFGDWAQYDADIYDESGITLKYGLGNHGLEGYYWTSTRPYFASYHYTVQFRAFDMDPVVAAADASTLSVICVRGGKKNA